MGNGIEKRYEKSGKIFEFNVGIKSGKCKCSWENLIETLKSWDKIWK